MSQFNRVVLGTICAVSLISTVGCGRRVPQADPCAPAEVAAERYRRMAAAPGLTRFAADAPADCPGTPADPGAPANPGAPAPGPAPIAPAPIDPGPAPIYPPGPGPDPIIPNPINNPPAPGPDQPAPPAPPAPGPDQPVKPEPVKPEPEPPKPSPEDLFLQKMSKIGFLSPKSVVDAIQKNVRLRPVGWTKGKYETPEKNIEAMWDATKILFQKIPETPQEYQARSMGFVESVYPADLMYYVDLKTSEERQDLYVMRFHPASTQIVGVKVGDTAYAPIGAQSAYRSASSGEAQIFFYGEERGRYITSDRFIAVPPKLLYPDWEKRMEAQRVQSQAFSYNAYQAPVYRR